MLTVAAAVAGEKKRMGVIDLPERREKEPVETLARCINIILKDYF